MASKNKKNDKKIFIDSDEVFAFIAGYTSLGMPYGVTWEEINEEEPIDLNDNEELPFS